MCNLELVHYDYILIPNTFIFYCVRFASFTFFSVYFYTSGKELERVFPNVHVIFYFQTVGTSQCASSFITTLPCTSYDYPGKYTLQTFNKI